MIHTLAKHGWVCSVKRSHLPWLVVPPGHWKGHAIGSDHSINSAGAQWDLVLNFSAGYVAYTLWLGTVLPQSPVQSSPACEPLHVICYVRDVTAEPCLNETQSTVIPHLMISSLAV